MGVGGPSGDSDGLGDEANDGGLGGVLSVSLPVSLLLVELVPAALLTGERPDLLVGEVEGSELRSNDSAALARAVETTGFLVTAFLNEGLCCTPPSLPMSLTDGVGLAPVKGMDLRLNESLELLSLD